MNEFNTLRAKAKEKRDRLIDNARRDYEQTLTAIAALEYNLLGREFAKNQSVADAVDSVIPDDRTFSITDIMTALEALDPRRGWRRGTVTGHITTLLDRGLVTRLRKAKRESPALYGRHGVTVPQIAFGDMTLPDAIRYVLASRPMRIMEVTVSLLEQGYETTMTPKLFRDRVGAELRRGKFRQEAGKWTVSEKI